MSTLTKAEASLVRGLMSHQGWELVQRLLADRLRDIQAEQVVGTNEFDTLRMLHSNQGRVDGLVKFFDDIEEGSFS